MSPRSSRRHRVIYYQTPAGRRELSSPLEDGRFRIRVPEEAALLFATWLVEHGEEVRAARLLDQVEPFKNQLRFYPVPASRP